VSGTCPCVAWLGGHASPLPDWLTDWRLSRPRDNATLVAGTGGTANDEGVPVVVAAAVDVGDGDGELGGLAAWQPSQRDPSEKHLAQHSLYMRGKLGNQSSGTTLEAQSDGSALSVSLHGVGRPAGWVVEVAGPSTHCTDGD
jgi:hypothetical protein